MKTDGIILDVDGTFMGFNADCGGRMDSCSTGGRRAETDRDGR